MLAGMVGRVTPADLRLSTPCASWTTRDLLNHLVGGAEMYAGALQGGPVGDISGRQPDVIGDDPAAAFGRAVEVFGAATQAPGSMERLLPLPFATMTGETFLRFVAFDLLVHSWDLGHTLDVERRRARRAGRRDRSLRSTGARRSAARRRELRSRGGLVRGGHAAGAAGGLLRSSAVGPDPTPSAGRTVPSGRARSRDHRGAGGRRNRSGAAARRRRRRPRHHHGCRPGRRARTPDDSTPTVSGSRPVSSTSTPTSTPSWAGTRWERPRAGTG